MKNYLLIPLSIILTVSACKKKTDPLREENKSVEIQSVAYPTTEIGKQTWTTKNFEGNGGVSTEEGHTILDGQNVYTIDVAKSLSLPSGWRVPTKADFEKLIRYIGETNPQMEYNSTLSELEVGSEFVLKLLAKNKWPSVSSNNLTGFNVIPLIEDNSYPAEHIIGSDFWCADVGRCHFDISMLINQPGTLSGMLFHNSADNSLGDRKAIRFVRDN